MCEAPIASWVEEDGWWCWECHGLGNWYEDAQETDEPGEVDCHCCGGDGRHLGDDAPACHPSRQPARPLAGETT